MIDDRGPLDLTYQIEEKDKKINSSTSTEQSILNRIRKWKKKIY